MSFDLLSFFTREDYISFLIKQRYFLKIQNCWEFVIYEKSNGIYLMVDITKITILKRLFFIIMY